MKWAAMFRDSHPDYLGLTPYGTRGIMPEGWPKRFLHQSKLCVSNPAVEDQIISDWRRKGAKEYLCVCENDGMMGFCRCERCRALDADLPGETFTLHKTDRYLGFWYRRFPDPSDKEMMRSTEKLPPGITTAFGADRFERSAKAAQ